MGQAGSVLEATGTSLSSVGSILGATWNASNNAMPADLVHLEDRERLTPLVYRVLGCYPGEFELQVSFLTALGTGGPSF